MRTWRQGDLLFAQIPEFPKGKRTVRPTGYIEEGEATGHIHRIADLDAAEVMEIESGVFLSVSEEGVSIVHEEHGPIMLPSGNYEVIRQSEYSPERIRNVQD